VKRAALCVLLAAGSALADPGAQAPSAPPDQAQVRAKELYTEGKRYYDVADYDHAIEAWKQAYVLASAPMLLFNLGQAYRLKGDCTSALRFYANYEREAGADVDKASLEEARARCNPQPTGANQPPTFPVSPQPPTAATLKAVDLTAHPAPPPPAEHTTSSGTKTIGIATAAGGVVLVGLGLYLEHVASDDAAKVSGYHGQWTQTQQDWQSSGQSAATWGAIATGAGIAAIAGGAVFYYLGMRSDRVDVAVTPHAVGLSWAGSF
jgi:tetratricopeptide (TPR) repeat protein